MPYLGLVQEMHNATKRNYVRRVVEFDKATCANIAKKFDSEYWDGERQYGYGGYHYDGRWLPLARTLISHFSLKPGDRVLDIGCGKGYLLYEFKRLMPDIELVGVDISEYAIKNAKEEVRQDLLIGSAHDLPFSDDEFDVVVSLGTLHNLPVNLVFDAVREIVRVCKSASSYIMVESWRNQSEKANLLSWQLTCEAFLAVETWEWLFEECDYKGDWDFIFFE